MDKPKDCVLLEVLNIAESNKSANAYVLILGDPEEHRHLPVIIGAAEAQSIAIELKGMSVPRPMTHDLFINLVNHTSFSLLYTEIYREVEGIYYANLVYSDGDSSFELDARTSDAVAIALRCSVPIYIKKEVLERNAVNYRKDGDTFQLEIEEEDEEELKAGLAKAIEEENYELAAQLRDKLKHLKS